MKPKTFSKPWTFVAFVVLNYLFEKINKIIVKDLISNRNTFKYSGLVEN